MTEPTDRDREIASDLLGVYGGDFVGTMAKAIAIVRAEGEAKGRREAIEECAKIVDKADLSIQDNRDGGKAVFKLLHRGRKLSAALRALAEHAAPK